MSLGFLTHLLKHLIKRISILDHDSIGRIVLPTVLPHSIDVRFKKLPRLQDGNSECQPEQRNYQNYSVAPYKNHS
jgi:hypothetical protein